MFVHHLPEETLRFGVRPSGDLPRWEGGMINFIDRRFEAIHRRYTRWLRGSLNYLPVTVVFSLIILGSIYFLYGAATSELAPEEDQGVIITSSTFAADATLQQRRMYSNELYAKMKSYPDHRHIFQNMISGRTDASISLEPWDERKNKNEQYLAIRSHLNQELGKLPLT